MKKLFCLFSGIFALLSLHAAEKKIPPLEYDIVLKNVSKKESLMVFAKRTGALKDVVPTLRRRLPVKGSLELHLDCPYILLLIKRRNVTALIKLSKEAIAFARMVKDQEDKKVVVYLKLESNKLRFITQLQMDSGDIIQLGEGAVTLEKAPEDHDEIRGNLLEKCGVCLQVKGCPGSQKIP